MTVTAVPCVVLRRLMGFSVPSMFVFHSMQSTTPVPSSIDRRTVRTGHGNPQLVSAVLLGAVQAAHTH